MTVPESLLSQLASVVGPIRESCPVGGGSISQALRINAEAGEFFLKFEDDSPAGFFEAERAGLEALRSAAPDSLGVPRVLATGDPNQPRGWLLLEWHDSSLSTAALQRSLGEGLARLHQTTDEGWGWPTDGFIGRMEQSNTIRDRWSTFWWEERLSPQLRSAENRGFTFGPEWQQLRESLPGLLGVAEDDGPSLLHGDLWSGNVLFTAERPVLIDPSICFGHREVDLAMADLFGGFSGDFFSAYREVWPLHGGWEIRREIYQLYYLLVHVNHFGMSYAARTRSTLRSILAAL